MTDCFDLSDRDLLVEVIATAPVDAQLYLLWPSNSNATVFDITRLPNSVGKCKIACSPYRVWLYLVWQGVTLPWSYNQGKYITCKLFKEHTCLAKDVSAFNISQATTWDLNRYKAPLHVNLVPDFTSLDAFRHYAYKHAIVKKVCQWLLPTNHTIPQLVLQLVDHLRHQLHLLNLVSCLCKTGCSQGYGCHWAGALYSSMCTRFIGITCTNTSQDSAF